MGLFDKFSKKSKNEEELNNILDQVLEKALKCLESDNDDLAKKGYDAIIKSAGMDHIPSILVLGEFLEDNYPDEALTWYERAANLGDASAYFDLGRMYEDGKGCKIDYNKAFEMYKKALAGGCEEAREKVEFWTRFYETVAGEVEKGKETAKKYINSSDPEMRKMARKILGMD